MKRLFQVLFILVCLSASTLYGQEEVSMERNNFADSKRYVIFKSSQPIIIDGRDNDPDWRNARYTEEFIDIEGEDRPFFSTRVKMLWDEKFLYVYARLEEEHVWASLTDHDAIIFHDNDFEVFIDPEGDGRNYSEIEVNALNTTWDLILDKPYRLGGQANDFYEMDGLETAVHVEGTLNEPSDVDDYWSVELAIPFESMMLAKHLGRKYPYDKEIWRMNFSRVQWNHRIVDGQYERRARNGRLLPEMNWVWSPMGEVNMHIPELWGYVQFSENIAGEQTIFEASSEEISERVAYALFRRFKFGDLVHFTDRKTSFTKHLPGFMVDNQRFEASYYKTAHGFEVILNNMTLGQKYLIDESGSLRKLGEY